MLKVLRDCRAEGEIVTCLIRRWLLSEKDSRDDPREWRRRWWPATPSLCWNIQAKMGRCRAVVSSLERHQMKGRVSWAIDVMEGPISVAVEGWSCRDKPCQPVKHQYPSNQALLLHAWRCTSASSSHNRLAPGTISAGYAESGDESGLVEASQFHLVTTRPARLLWS
jgi:hypothetical protein